MTWSRLIWGLLVLFPGVLFPAAPPDPGEALVRARAEHDDKAIEEAQKRILEEVEAHPQDHRLLLLAAQSYLCRADMLRNERVIRKLDSATNRDHRRLQAEWGAAGMPLAEKALAAASTAGEKAQSERTIGELFVHQIDGPIAGMLNGPKALSHIRAALALAPDDPECNRAIGLMYLFNSPVNGGDLEKAVKTFRKCAEAVPSSDDYQLHLALAYRKKQNSSLARMAARKAIELNPRNTDARQLLEVLGPGTPEKVGKS